MKSYRPLSMNSIIGDPFTDDAACEAVGDVLRDEAEYAYWIKNHFPIPEDEPQPAYIDELLAAMDRDQSSTDEF